MRPAQAAAGCAVTMSAAATAARPARNPRIPASSPALSRDARYDAGWLVAVPGRFVAAATETLFTRRRTPRPSAGALGAGPPGAQRTRGGPRSPRRHGPDQLNRAVTIARRMRAPT